MRFYRFDNLVVILFLLILFWVQLLFPFISIKGGTFVNDHGKEIFFRGVGLGGWLVPEGYMLHFPGYGSPSSINAQIVDLIGEQNAQLFWQRYRLNYVNSNDIKKIAFWGFNLIRLPFNYRLISPEDQPGVYLEEGFAVIDSLLQWCRDSRLYVILDMHCAPGGQNADNISDSDGIEARLWTDPSNQDRTVDIWQTIAARYANDTTLIGYDLLNEPVLPEGHTSTELRTLYMRITSAIRQVDKNHIIFVEGNWYGTDFEALTPPWDTKMSYSFHKYWSSTDVQTIQSYLNIRKTYNLPLWMGESGENSNHWFASAVKLFEENNISWCWWTHKKFETTTSPYSAHLPTGFQTLVDYWNGQAAKPNASFALSVLLQLAENLNLEKCEFHPDVLQALFNRQFLTQNTPFKNLEIPGKINCIDYDFGGNGIAYNDTDYERNDWQQHTPWNTGGKYRNDGVDIEQSNDAAGAEFSIGWIEANEWLKFTVHVQTTGLFDVVLRIASAQAGGQLQLLIDDHPISQVITVPTTGGWYNWDTITINNIPLQAGNQVLTLKFIKGGFNINQLEFVKVTNINNQGNLPVKFNLGQNYPNPFNQSTFIPFYVNQKSTINLDIFTVAGQRVFSQSINESGSGYFYWQGQNEYHLPLSSGIYFYRVSVKNQTKIKKMVLLR